MPFDPDKYLADQAGSGSSPAFDPEAYLKQAKQAETPSFGATIDDDIGRISDKYKVDPEFLHSRQIGMGYYPSEQAEKLIAEGKHGQHILNAASAAANEALGEGLLGGAPAWIQKKLSSDNEEAAIDELRKAVDHHKSGTDLFREALQSATPANVLAKGLKLGKVGTMALNLADAARQGATESDADEEGSGAAHAAMMAGGVMGTLEAIPKVGKAIGWVGKKAGNLAFGVPEQATERYLARPGAVRDAGSLKNISDQFIDEVHSVKEGLSGDSGEAYKILQRGPEGEVGRMVEPLQDAVDIIHHRGAVGPERKSAVGYIEGLISDVNKMSREDAALVEAIRPGGAPASDMIQLDRGKTVISVLDSKIAEVEKKNGDKQVLQALRHARSGIDGYLKATVPAYADHMEKLAEDTRAAVGISNAFRSEEGAFNTLRQILRGKSEYKAEHLAKFDEQFGTNFADKLKDSYAKDAFTKDTTNGSRKTLAGSVVGSMLGSAIGGGPVGGALGGAGGAGAGMAADKYGGRLYQGLLDGTLKAGKYAAPLAKVYEQRGPAALAATHIALLRRDPEYKKAFEEIPKVTEAKKALDDGLTEHVVDPFARAGHEDLGAALATVPSTLAEALVPSTPSDALPGSQASQAAIHFGMYPLAKWLTKEQGSALRKTVSKIPELLDTPGLTAVRKRGETAAQDLWHIVDHAAPGKPTVAQVAMDWSKHTPVIDWYENTAHGTPQYRKGVVADFIDRLSQHYGQIQSSMVFGSTKTPSGARRLGEELFENRLPRVVQTSDDHPAIPGDVWRHLGSREFDEWLRANGYIKDAM